MNRKSVAYSGILLLALILVSLLLNRDVIRGLTSDSHVTLTVVESTHLVGQDVVFNGSLIFANNETSTITRLRLRNTSGPQALDVDLPLADTAGNFVDLSSLTAATQDKLLVKVTFVSVSSLGGTLPSGTLPGTLPGSTLPAGGNFKGTAAGASIDIVAIWSPPVFLDPAPSLTLIPQTDTFFTIPTLAPPSEVAGTKLGDTGYAWDFSGSEGDIPTAGQTAGTALPSATSTFAIPQITISTNAPSVLPDIPNSIPYMGTGATSSAGFAIPTLTVATSSAASFPVATDAFAIPAPTIATSSVSGFGEGQDFQWYVPDANGATTTPQIVKGMTHDGTNFWFILAGANNDTIISVNSSGILQASSTAPSNKFDGIAAIGSSLYVLENKQRCGDDIQTSGDCADARILKIASSGTLPSSSAESDWAPDSSNPVTGVWNPGNQWDRFGGLTAGSGSDLWVIHDMGEKFYKLYTSGILAGQERASYQGQWESANALGFSSSLLYTAYGSTITRWTDQGQKVDDTSITGDLKALAFDGNTLYFVNNDDGKLYATFMGMSVDSPVTSKGVAYSTDSAGNTALWILVDGSPKDYIVKVNPSTGALVTGFGIDVASDGTRDGWSQAPSAATEGIEYFGSALYIISNEGSGWDTTRKLYKVNATTGDVESGYPKNLSNQNVYDDLGDITNNGTSLIAWTKSNFNDVYTMDTAASNVTQSWVEGVPWQGSKALAYHPTQQLYYAASGTELSKLDTNFNQVASENLSTAGTSFSTVEGMTFTDAAPYNDLWFVSGARAYHSYISAAATTEPVAIAWSSDEVSALGSTEALWVIVNASPFDTIMRINTSDGSLNTTFDNDGLADAPSGNIEGAVFVTEGNSHYLYMVANDPGQDQWNKKKNLYKYNVKTNTVEAGYPKNLQDTAMVFDDVGGLTYDGTDLIVSAKTHGSMWKVSTTGDMRAEGWPCCVPTFGITALAYHTARSTLYGAKNAVILSLSNDLQTITEANATVNGASISSDSIGAMTFGSDVLYIARTSSGVGYITAAAFASTVLTTPQGLTLSPDSATYLGTNVGAALWVVVDGTPNDRVIKLTGSGASWTADTQFGSDTIKNGSAELPNANITGVSFYDNALWVIGKPSYDAVLYKLNPVTGAELNSYQLCGGGGGGPGGGGGGGGMQMCDAPGGLAHDGTNFIVSGLTEERFWFINDSGQVQNESPSQYQLGGAHAVDYIQSDKTYWTSKGTQIQSWINPFANDIWPAATYNNTANMTNIKGLVIEQTAKTIYMAWDVGAVGYISQAVPPSPITNNPLDLAYNGDDGVLYVLVDGSGGDVVVAVNPQTGAIVRDDDGAEMFYTLNSEDATALAYLGGKIYAVYEERQGPGSYGPPPSQVTVLNTSLVEEAGSPYNIMTDFGQIRGLTSNGTQLIATSEYGGARVDMIDPTGFNRGQEVHFWDPSDPQFSYDTEGFSDVAFSTGTPMYFVAKGNQLYRAEEQGDITDSWSINAPSSGTLNSIAGLAFVDDGLGGKLLFMADAGTDKIYSAYVPLPTINITNKPRAMATDGSFLWIAVDADPVDKIIKMAVSTSTATVLTSFDSPGTETDGLAIHEGKLWVLVNDTQTVEVPSPGGGGTTQMQITLPMLFSLNKSSGAELSESVFMINIPYQGPDFVKTLMGGLTSDGQYLYTGSVGDPSRGDPGKLFRINLDDPLYKMKFGMMIGGPKLTSSDQFQGILTHLDSIQAMVIATSTAGFNNDRRVIVAGAPGYGNQADRIARFDLNAVSSGAAAGAVMLDQYELTGKNIKGLAYIDTILYMADDSGIVIGTALPENTGVEMTIVGDYVTSVTATTDLGTFSGSASYSLVRNTDVAVQLTSPGGNFVATGTSATISGRISDPAITSVSVGIQLPFTEFLTDPDADATLWTSAASSGSVNWFADSGGNCPQCGTAAWRFGVPGQKSFADGENRVAATLTSNTKLPIASGSLLKFNTAWETEFQPDMDIKRVQVATVTQDLQGNDKLGSWETIAQVVQFVDPNPTFMPQPTDAHANFQWLAVPPLPFAPGQKHPVSIDLTGLAGQNIKIRFQFDSVDGFANDFGVGWFVDDITVSGSGTQTISIATTALATPVVATVNGTSTTLYRSFTTTFTLAEGHNTVIATAVQPYSPSLSGSATTQGFVDTLAPVITLAGVPANTNVVIQTLTGTLVEPTIGQPGALMQVTHNVTTVSGATSSVVIGKVTTEGAFSFGVSLQEGTNTFVATATDGGGLTTSQTVIAIADLTPPTAQIGIVTVTSEGEAIVGDQYFVVVAATDALSGVATSTLVSTGIVMSALGDVPAILVQMHGLAAIGATTSTHITLATVESGTPVAVHDVAVMVTDRAGNSITATGSLNVVSDRSNRNYFLFPGNNFMGLAIVPDDGNATTTDDASMDRLMAQDISDRVSDGFKTYMSTSTIVLGDVVESTFAFNKAGNFIVHTPGPAADTLTNMSPFQGMNINTKKTVGATTTIEVFKQVSVTGFSGQQAVPIRINIQGVFFRLNELPPTLEMRVGFNLIAPHILRDTEFDTVLRGGLVPREVAVSAITFDRRVAATMGSSGISAQIVEEFATKSKSTPTTPGGTLKPELSYWAFIASDPLDTRLNDLGEPLGPTIVPQ